jgi:hypothetical protein
VNRSIEKMSVKLVLENWRPEHVHLTQLAGSGTFDQNTEEHPNEIVPSDTDIGNGALIQTPGQSVSRVILTR